MTQLGPASVPPGRSTADPADEDPFQSLLPSLCVVAGLTHVGFLLLFMFSGLTLLALVNVASIACYVIVSAMVRRRYRVIITFGLIAVEVLAHAVVATAILGWGSGFHYYALLLVPVFMVSNVRPPLLKLSVVAAAALGYLGLDLWLREAAPPRTLPSQWSLELVYYFNVMSTLLILAILAGSYYQLINQTQAALHLMATTDPLTRLRNRNSLEDIIGQQQSRAQRGHSLSFIMCDIDHFKQINDHGGHAAGDAVLQSLSVSMAASVRDADVIGRWGGEEFLVILPDADAPAAFIVAERLRNDVASLPVLVEGGPARITVTIGVATVGPGETAAQAINRADIALYNGKRAGRNRVVEAAAAALLLDGPVLG